MKNIIFLLAVLMPLPAFAIKILKVTNMSKDRDSSEVRTGDVIKVDLDYEGSPVKPGPFFLVLNGEKTSIQSVDLIVTGDNTQALYFHLDASKIASAMEKLVSADGQKASIKLDIADASGNLTKLGYANLTLVLPEKALLLKQKVWKLDHEFGVSVQTIAQFNTLPAKKEEIKLFVEGQLLEHATCSGVTQTPTGAEIYFQVNGTEFAKKFYVNDAVREIKEVSIGTTNKASISTNETLTVVFMHPYGKFAFWMIFATIGFVIYRLAVKTDLLKDTTVGDDRKSYSLARTQFAFWTFFILNGLIYILFASKAISEFPSSAFILLGISATLTLTSQLLENKDGAAAASKQGFVEQNKLKQFFTDILSDKDGINIHRLQNLLFTLFMGAYFWGEVINHLTIPEIETNLLILMGVSGAAYAVKKGMTNS